MFPEPEPGPSGVPGDRMAEKASPQRVQLSLGWRPQDLLGLRDGWRLRTKAVAGAFSNSPSEHASICVAFQGP